MVGWSGLMCCYMGQWDVYRNVVASIFVLLLYGSLWCPAQVSVHETRDHGNADYMVVMKGAPERIVSRCTHCMSW